MCLALISILNIHGQIELGIRVCFEIEANEMEKKEIVAGKKKGKT